VIQNSHPRHICVRLSIPRATLPRKRRRRRRYIPGPHPPSSLIKRRRRDPSAARLCHQRALAVIRAVNEAPAASRRHTVHQTPSRGASTGDRWWGAVRGKRAICVDLPGAAALEAAVDAAKDGEEDQAADGGGDADDDGFVVVDPGFDFLAEGGAGAPALDMSC
jgi:hypothetical protein